MRRPGLLHAVELDDHRALLKSCFVDLRRQPACQDTPAGRGDRQTAELGIGANASGLLTE